MCESNQSNDGQIGSGSDDVNVVQGRANYFETSEASPSKSGQNSTTDKLFVFNAQRTIPTHRIPTSNPYMRNNECPKTQERTKVISCVLNETSNIKHQTSNIKHPIVYISSPSHDNSQKSHRTSSVRLH